MDLTKDTLKGTLEHHKLDVRKMEPSIKALDYYTQKFFETDKPMVVPAIHMGEASREINCRIPERPAYEMTTHEMPAYSDFNQYGVSSRLNKELNPPPVQK